AGKTNREIASDLAVSEKTVNNWLAHALAKLHLTPRAEAALRVTIPHAAAPLRSALGRLARLTIAYSELPSDRQRSDDAGGESVADPGLGWAMVSNLRRLLRDPRDLLAVVLEGDVPAVLGSEVAREQLEHAPCQRSALHEQRDFGVDRART